VVLELMAHGVSNAEFAERLCVAEAVVKRRVGNMFISLGVCEAPRRSRYECSVGRLAPRASSSDCGRMRIWSRRGIRDPSPGPSLIAMRAARGDA
jgi:hypothetical protein